MKAHLLVAAFITVVFFACSGDSSKTSSNKDVQHDTLKTGTLFEKKKDSLLQNGEYLQHYKSGVVEMLGEIKNGKREGVWKSFYETNSPWSETTFEAGKKNGKTTTWYENGKKRYEGFYTNDKESGSWTFWDEKGTVISTKKY
jgi:antitoxin component YwqK of YwqJK toxin-antitoxin module